MSGFYSLLPPESPPPESLDEESLECVSPLPVVDALPSLNSPVDESDEPPDVAK